MRGNNREQRPRLPALALLRVQMGVVAAIEDDLGRLTFVDYGAGKGRVLLLASQHPFTAVGGIEFAEELHDNATMNIAQFPRSRMKCRNVECVLDDAANITAARRRGGALFLQPVRAGDVRRGAAAGSSRRITRRPRRLYLVLIDMDVADLMHKSGVFQEVQLPLTERISARLLSPYTIASTVRSPTEPQQASARRAERPRDGLFPHRFETGLSPPQGEASAQRHFTPSFFCRLDDEVVYWKISFLSG